MIKIIVLATTNRKKVAEFERILAGFQVEIKSLADFGPLPQAIEDGETFEENAYKKAHHFARVLGLPAIADDSGLVVPALGGAPGVYSARYAGPEAGDADNVAKLLTEMRDISDRKAYFQCNLSIAVPSGPALSYEATCAGVITREERGSSGFGYDPVFFFEEAGKTFAEMGMDEKNRVSHRGKALAEVKRERDKIFKWLDMRLAEEKPEKPDHSQFLANDWSQD